MSNFIIARGVGVLSAPEVYQRKNLYAMIDHITAHLSSVSPDDLEVEVEKLKHAFSIDITICANRKVVIDLHPERCIYI
jgi:hypothetical protein